MKPEDLPGMIIVFIGTSIVLWGVGWGLAQLIQKIFGS